MHIVMFSSSLGGGGAERSLVILADGFRAKGHKVTVVTYMEEVPDFYTLGEGIELRRIPLGRNHSLPWFDIKGNIRRLRLFRRYLKAEEPDVILSFLDGTNEYLLLSTFFWHIPKVISCQVDIRHHPAPNRRWRLLRSLVYPLADRIVFLDDEQARWCAGNFRGWKTTGIPNPVAPVPERLPKVPIPGGMRNNLVAMGRLAHQKGFDLLIDAFSKIAPKFPQWGLIILGEGPLRTQLEEQINSLGLGGQVFLPGAFSPPFSLLMQCDIFVFPSRYEGQGMALMEAMACGLPAVSFDCPSGPGYIIRDGRDGLLVPPGDIDAFAQVMDKLMEDEGLRRRMGRDAQGVKDRFGCDGIVERWLLLFREIGVENL